MGSKQVCIITGASQGLGQCLLTSMKDKNWNIVAHGKSQAECADFKNDPNVKWVYGDLCDPNTMKNIYNCCMENFKRCDCLILNAAMMEPLMEIEKMDMMMMKKHFDVNLFSCMQMAQMCMKMIKESKGKIIGVTADCAKSPSHACSAYCCSKAALNMFMQCLAKEMPECTCLAFEPCEMDTGMHDKMMDQGKDKMKEDFSKMSQSNPVDPNMVANSLMNVMMMANKDWSGSIMKWDDQRIKQMKK